MPEATPIYDEIHKFMTGIKAQAPAIEDALQKMGKAFEGWHVYIDRWGESYKNNRHVFGIENISSFAEQERQKRKERYKKEQENCLHGRSPFRITWAWGVTMKCPKCYSNQVIVGSEKLRCFLCGWGQWRIGKRRVRFANG